MNLFDSAFLCLDIGSTGVRGMAHRVRGAKIVKSAISTSDCFDTVFALRSVIDDLERQIGTSFDTAYVTGNFGASVFEMTAKSTAWGGEHKITAADIQDQIAQITPPDGYFPMHIVPLRYDTPSARNMATPVGYTDRQLISAFGAIFYARARMDTVLAFLRRAHITASAFYDPQFLLNATLRQKKQNVMFIDLGGEFSSASIWTDRGPVWHRKIPMGGTKITNTISEKLHICFDDAERVKRAVASFVPKEMDRFTPADTAYEFSRGDINDIFMPAMVDIAAEMTAAAHDAIIKYRPTKIILTGGGALAEGATEFIENTFSIPTEYISGDAIVRAGCANIWNAEAAHRGAYLARRDRIQRNLAFFGKLFKRTKKSCNRFIPIMPSTLCFNMRRASTYSMFRAGGISMIHVDIMDGFYVERVAGGISELKMIRAYTDAHLHVHLMTESPSVWAADSIAAGADTVILSTNTSGLRAAIAATHAAGRRVGVALNPESSPAILKPILRDLDEVMVMTVRPGAAGQKFQTDCLKKISILDATRKKYGLKFTISVDGGIDDKTAQMCWDAGADLLVSGSYLARSPDFPLAVQSLLKQS